VRWSILVLVCILLASCATMKDKTPPDHEGPCKEAYQDAIYGEKEALAGTILLPAGIAIGGGVWGFLFTAGDANMDLVFITIPVFSAVGGLIMLAGIVTIIDGHRRVDMWNNTCTGTTIAERYCLFDEPVMLPEPSE